MQVGEALHDLLEVHFEQFWLEYLQQPEIGLEPPVPATQDEAVPKDPAQITAHLAP